MAFFYLADSLSRNQLLSFAALRREIQNRVTPQTVIHRPTRAAPTFSKLTNTEIFFMPRRIKGFICLLVNDHLGWFGDRTHFLLPFRPSLGRDVHCMCSFLENFEAFYDRTRVDKPVPRRLVIGATSTFLPHDLSADSDLDGTARFTHGTGGKKP